MTYYRDLREFIAEAEKRGKVHHFTAPMDKDSDILSLARLQLRAVSDAERKILVFDKVVNAKGDSYDMRVATGVYGASEELVTLGMGCDRPEEMLERWCEAESNPFPPRIVASGPVQEVVHTGDALKDVGLDMIPAAVEEPGFSQIIRTGLPCITRDPETGIRNVGTYNGFFRDRDRIVAGINFARPTMRVHWDGARRAGRAMPMAIVVGCTPNLMIAGSATVPYGVDEMAVAGGIAGEGVELVECKTVPLEVPAHAELVIEGYVSTEVLEPNFAFGEYPGYMNVERNYMPVMTVTAITHRPDPIFTPVFVGFPPSDTNAILQLCKAAPLYKRLQHDCMMPVRDIYLPQAGGGAMCFIRLEKGAAPGAARRVMDITAGVEPGIKYLVVVDDDINVRDPEMIAWALTFRTRPESDLVVQAGRFAGLDPSFGATGSSRGKTGSHGSNLDHYKVMIDATRSGPYPPVALPRREFMERALELWRAEPGLPEARVREPWYGYELGYWSEEDQELADLMVRGDYRDVGRRAAELQVSADEVLEQNWPR